MNTTPHSRHALAHGALGCPSADEQAQQDVCSALSRTPGLDATGLGVSLDEAGEVQLIGAVPCKRQRDLALRVARRVAGSRPVHSRIELLRPDEPTRVRASR